jgi:TonB family protein
VPDGIGGYAYEVKELDRAPELSNKGQIGSIMERLYPRPLQNAGIGGTVVSRFVIEADGTVNMNTLKLESSNGELTAASIAAVERFRFRPGWLRDRPVRTLITMPITWQPASRRDTTAVAIFPGAQAEAVGVLSGVTRAAVAEGASRQAEATRQQEIIERAKILVAQRYPALLAETQPQSATLFVIVAPDGSIRDSRLIRAGEDFSWPAGTPTNFKHITVVRDADWLQFAPALIGTGLMWFEL